MDELPPRNETRTTPGERLAPLSGASAEQGKTPLGGLPGAVSGSVRSAERAQPAHGAAAAPAPLRHRLKHQAEDGALNTLAALREAAHALGRADQYTRYKLYVVATWLLLSVLGLVVACPGGPGGNALGAVLIADTGRNEFLVRNESTSTWKGARVTVNGQYATVPAETPPGESIVFTWKQLQGPSGAAPGDILVEEIQLVTEGDSVELMSEGQPLQ